MFVLQSLFDNKVFAVIGTILIIGLLAYLTYLLFLWVKKDIQLTKEEKSTHIEGVLTKSAMHSLISGNIAKLGNLGNFTLMYVDLDNFSDLSSAFGQKEAKKILTTIVQRIKKTLPRDISIGRYKGDEFLIFIPNFDRLETLEYANNVLKEIREKIELYGETEIEQTASIALCYYPQHGGTVKDLIESLKIAIYNVKKNGGNDCLVYSESQNDNEDFVEYFYQIRSAIENKEFLLYYQPMINVNSKKFYGFEALIRWNHPTLGVLAPNKFINIMEQSGDIHWVGQWGFETILKTYSELSKVLPYPFKVSINLSAKQLLDETLAINFQKILKKHKIQPENIVLEMGEFALFEKDKTVNDTLKRLKVIGFKLAVDGFGLDYGSLERAEQLGIDIIKVDMKYLYDESFVAKKTLQVLLDYAKEKQVDIICEAVEDLKDVKKVQATGIEYVQGYLISKPIDLKKLKTFIENFLIMPIDLEENEKETHTQPNENVEVDLKEENE